MEQANRVEVAVIKEEQPMRLEEREATIQKMIDECDHDQKERSEERIFKKWRVKLEQEPTLLKPYEIDVIVRAVRDRINNAS